MAVPEFFYLFTHDSKVWVVPAAQAVLTLNALDGTSRVALCSGQGEAIEGIRKVDLKPATTVEAAARRMYVELKQEIDRVSGKQAAGSAAGGAV